MFAAPRSGEQGHGRPKQHHRRGLCEVFSFILLWWNLLGASANHIAVGWLSDNLPVADVLEWISETTKRGALDKGATGLQQQGAIPGGEPTDGISWEGVLEPQEQLMPP